MDLSDWLTEAEAAERLTCSVKTIQRYAAKGKIEIRKRIRPGAKPENVCAPRDIDRLIPAAHVMPADPEPAPEPETGLVSVHQVVAPMRALLETLSAIAGSLAAAQTAASNRKPKPEVPIEAKIWLTLTEAVAYSGLPRRELRNYLRDGTFDAKMFGRRWRVLRSSIERGSLRTPETPSR